MIDFQSPRGGAGAPVKTDSGNLKTRRFTTLDKNERGSMIKLFSPFMKFEEYLLNLSR